MSEQEKVDLERFGQIVKRFVQTKPKSVKPEPVAKVR